MNPDKIEALKNGIHEKYPQITFVWIYYETYQTVIVEGMGIQAFSDLIAEKIHQDCDEIINGFSV